MSKKKKNIAFIPILLVTLIVWGVIIYKVIAHLKSSEDANPEIVTNTANVADPINRNSIKADIIETEYASLERDPFVLKGISKVKDNKELNGQTNSDVAQKLLQKQKADSPHLDKIQYTINGVIINKESKLVILEDITNKKTIFMREKEEYKDIIIKAIYLNKVVVTENGSKKEIEIKK